MKDDIIKIQALFRGYITRKRLSKTISQTLIEFTRVNLEIEKDCRLKLKKINQGPLLIPKSLNKHDLVLGIKWLEDAIEKRKQSLIV